jgi:DNA-binding CsgD family transcriptional regulator
VAEVLSGKTNKEIALKLGLSNQTVNHHLTGIFNDVFNRPQSPLFVDHHNLLFRFANK